MAVEMADMVIAHHIPVEVDAVAAGSGTVVDGVDKIRPAFEGLDGEPFASEGSQQTKGNGGLARPAVGRRDEELRIHEGKILILTNQLCLHSKHGLFG